MQIGDIVRLKSGGPKMTITALDDASASCAWFDRNGRNQSDDFPLATIEMFIARPPALERPAHGKSEY